ncbi:MAG: hypothetical protein E2O59_03965 [Gammaproteobacteria bacterium]|nr:MAG: hypothetical protein E2O59_03965 [Gammaproteobacteria bacterium]
MSSELERFCVLFDRLVHLTSAGVSATEDDLRTWQPNPDEGLSIGTRIKTVTIKSLFIHQVVTEHLWIHAAASCEEGASMPKPSDAAELTARLNEGDYLEEASLLHAVNMELLRSFTESTLAKKVEFVGRNWTVMGFLWSMYGHHSYHLGHIDMYWRQSGNPGPDFHRFDPPEMA